MELALKEDDMYRYSIGTYSYLFVLHMSKGTGFIIN
jgi:hypothetical protein